MVFRRDVGRKLLNRALKVAEKFGDASKITFVFAQRGEDKIVEFGSSKLKVTFKVDRNTALNVDTFLLKLLSAPYETLPLYIARVFALSAASILSVIAVGGAFEGFEVPEYILNSVFSLLAGLIALATLIKTSVGVGVKHDEIAKAHRKLMSEDPTYEAVCNDLRVFLSQILDVAFGKVRKTIVSSYFGTFNCVKKTKLNTTYVELVRAC